MGVEVSCVVVALSLSCYFDSGHGSRFQCAVRGVEPEVFVSRELGVVVGIQ